MSTQTRSGPGPETDAVARQIVDSAFHVHRELGPGLLESVYQVCLAHELENRGIDFRCEVPMPVRYRSVTLDAGFRLDMVVADLVVVENKAVEQLLPLHEAQLITYLKLSGFKIGLLINWNVRLIKNGIKRIAY